MDKRRSSAKCSSTDHHVSACPFFKQGIKAIGFSLEDKDESKIDHEGFKRRVIAKFGPRFFFCNLDGNFKSDYPQLGILRRISSTQGIKKLCQALKLATHAC